MPEAVQDATTAMARAHHDEVEAACEEALAGGAHGVLLTADGYVGVDPQVPYGQIHEVQGHTQAWALRHMTGGAG
jgi:hypothetical protein